MTEKISCSGHAFDKPIMLDLRSGEMEKKFKSQGTIYKRKIEPIRKAEQVTEPQTIETLLPDGTLESSVVAQIGDWVITGTQGERFVFNQAKFDERYSSDGNGCYVPKERRVVAIVNHYQGPVKIVAPWSTPQIPAHQMGSGDCFLVVTLDENGELTDDRYIIGSKELLLNNYEPVGD